MKHKDWNFWHNSDEALYSAMQRGAQLILFVFLTLVHLISHIA